MDLESMLLSEISQRKTNTIWFQSYVGLKKQNKRTKKKGINQKTRFLTNREQAEGDQRGGRWGDWLNRAWGLRRVPVMSSGYWMEVLNHYIVPVILILHYKRIGI